MIKAASHLSLNVKALFLSRSGYFHYTPLLTVHCYPGVLVSAGPRGVGMAHRTDNEPQESGSLN